MQAESWLRDNWKFNKARVVVNKSRNSYKRSDKSSGTVIPSLKLPELFCYVWLQDAGVHLQLKQGLVIC